jgi:hypothetical protein
MSHSHTENSIANVCCLGYSPSTSLCSAFPQSAHSCLLSHTGALYECIGQFDTLSILEAHTLHTQEFALQSPNQVSSHLRSIFSLQVSWMLPLRVAHQHSRRIQIKLLLAHVGHRDDYQYCMHLMGRRSSACSCSASEASVRQSRAQCFNCSSSLCAYIEYCKMHGDKQPCGLGRKALVPTSMFANPRVRPPARRCIGNLGFHLMPPKGVRFIQL